MGFKPMVSFMGQVPLLRDSDSEDRSDFRPVPASDTGNSYADQGMLGSFRDSDDSYRSPDDIVRFDGHGATGADLDRGFIVPTVREQPAYDKINYAKRSSDAMRPDQEFGNTESRPSDWEFQSRNNTSRGFLTRPRIPTER